ncbi:MAG TPA: BlaI/MecI/CopY family transcriptional regulator [Planctomycetaceae bacterium]|jgi:predicted transcriptional regulator|nr:BlaI/MecI/CopY family transcriptional regulator [Planctomycetaceae bacterium]
MFGRKKQPSVSPLENAVMAVLWSRASATADDVRTALGKERNLKESTVRTLLRRLEEKGFVAHDVDGRTYVYRPKVDRQNVATQAVRAVIERFCSGSVEALLAGMVDGDLITPAKLRQLADRIDEAEHNPSRSTSPRSKKSDK